MAYGAPKCDSADLGIVRVLFFLPWQVYLLGTLSIAGSLWRVG